MSSTVETSGYDLSVRLFGGMWFFLLAGVTVCGIYETVLQSLARICLTGFYLILGYLIITRPPALAQLSGVAPRVLAFVGTYMMWGAVVLPHTPQGTVQQAWSVVFLLLGIGLMLVTICFLGQAFSIVPQGRMVVQNGPYRLVRHPLYLAEELATLGMTLQFFSPLTTTVLLTLHVMVQFSRIGYEEKLLSMSLPEYTEYARIVPWRIVPHVW